MVQVLTRSRVAANSSTRSSLMGATVWTSTSSITWRGMRTAAECRLP